MLIYRSLNDNNINVLLDLFSEMEINNQINRLMIASGAIFNCKDINMIQSFLNVKAMEKLLYYFAIRCCLWNLISISANLDPEHISRHSQWINVFDHIRPILNLWHWLPMPGRITMKVFVFTVCKCELRHIFVDIHQHVRALESSISTLGLLDIHVTLPTLGCERACLFAW